FRLVKEGIAASEFYTMHALAGAKGYGLGWIDLTGISRFHRFPGRVDKQKPAGGVKLPGKKDEGTIITLTPEQVLEGSELDHQGEAAANVKCRVASVRMVKPNAPPVDIAAPGGFVRMHMQGGGLMEFAEELSPKNWPWLPPPTITTDKEGRF